MTSLTKGKGLAHFVIDGGEEHDLIWVLFLQNGEVWCIPNPDIRADNNWTYGRNKPTDEELADKVTTWYRETPQWSK